MTIISVVSLVTVVLGFVFPKSRKVTIGMLIVIWMLYAFSNDNGDYINYYYDYLKISRGDFDSFGFNEEGYIYFAYFCSNVIHLDYQSFLVLSSTICTPLLGYIVCELTPRPNSVLSLFMLNPYWMMICQTRFYFAFLFVMLGFVALHVMQDWKGPLLFTVAVIVASLFHRSALLCIVLVFSKLKSVKGILIMVAIMAPTSLLITLPIFRDIAMQLIGEFKVDHWLISESRRSISGIISLCLVQLSILVVSLLAYKRIHERDCQYRWADPIIKAIILTIVFLPMECMDKNYERYARFLLIFLYLLRGHYLDGKWSRRLDMPAGILVLDACIIGYYVFFYASFTGWFEHNLVPIMTSSALFEQSL